MIHQLPFAYKPGEHECEKASYSYVMSLVAIVAGLPLPIINLIATFIFWAANTKGTAFVRWHCTQALFSQLSMLIINTIGFWWTVGIIFRDQTINNYYIAYIITLLLFNLTEFIATIYTAVQTRKGKHIQWWLYGDIANLLVKK
jgi:hypothetical protein